MDRLSTKRLFLVSVCLLPLWVPAVRAQVDVWIDTDPSIGMAFRDADDGFALIQAFHSPELSIRGISVTYGNTSLQESVVIARDLAARLGSEAGVSEENVFAGAASAWDLGRSTAATQALATALAERPLIYVALGPLTNLATLLKCRPDLTGRIERVVFIGGRLPGERFYLGNRLPYEFHDANFEKDVQAALTVLRSPLPLELVPVAASKDVLFTPDDLARLGRDGGKAGQFLENNTKLWMQLWRWLFGMEGGPAFDSLAVLAVAHPEEFSRREAEACISADLDRCQPIAGDDASQKRFLLVGGRQPEPGSTGRRVRYDSSAKPGAKQKILAALLKRGALPQPQATQ